LTHHDWAIEFNHDGLSAIIYFVVTNNTNFPLMLEKFRCWADPMPNQQPVEIWHQDELTPLESARKGFKWELHPNRVAAHNAGNPMLLDIVGYFDFIDAFGRRIEQPFGKFCHVQRGKGFFSPAHGPLKRDLDYVHGRD